MQNTTEEFQLIKDFQTLGLEDMIPCLNTNANGEYMDYESMESRSLFYIDKKPHDYDEEDYNEENCSEVNRQFTVYELKELFDCIDMNDDDFLCLGVNDLLGITKSQLKFLDMDLLYQSGLEAVWEYMHAEWLLNEIPDVQQRIRFAQVYAITQADLIRTPIRDLGSQKKVQAMVHKIILKERDIQKTIHLIQLYKDYLSAYNAGLEMNEERIQNDEQPYRYTLTPKPSHLKDLHDKAMQDLQIIKSRQAGSRIKETNKRIKDVIGCETYKRFLCAGAKYSIIKAKDYDDIINEGEQLHHCVASYIDDFSYGSTYLYFVRKNDSITTPYFTLEVKLERRGGKDVYCLKQCFGINNTTEKPASLKIFLTEWANRKNIKIICDV